MVAWSINEKEFQAVLALPDTRRYEYFVKRVADREEVWSLWNDGWLLAGDDQGNEIVPVWPHPTFAEACALEEWADSQPRAVEISAWLERWLPGMARDGRLVAVFPTPTVRSGVVVPPERFRDDLLEELSRYE